MIRWPTSSIERNHASSPSTAGLSAAHCPGYRRTRWRYCHRGGGGRKANGTHRDREARAEPEWRSRRLPRATAASRTAIAGLKYGATTIGGVGGFGSGVVGRWTPATRPAGRPAEVG